MLLWQILCEHFNIILSSVMHVHVNSCCQDEIDAYAPEYAKMKDFGDHVTEGQSDPQYMFLAQRLSALDDGWKELLQMWDSRQQGLSQDLNLQVLEKNTLLKSPHFESPHLTKSGIFVSQIIQ